MTLDIDAIRDFVRSEIPRALNQDPLAQHAVWETVRSEFADKQQTESRFEQLLEELRRDREDQNRKWDEQNRKWEENQRVINATLEEIRLLNRKHDRRTERTAQNLGIEVYHYAEEVTL